MEPVVIVILFFGVLFSLITGCVMCERKGSRITFGIVTLAWSGLMFLAAHTAESFDLNVWYSASAHNLLDESIKAIEAGRQDEVADALKRMNDNLEVTYEHRGNFKDLANKTSSELEQNRKQAEQPADGKTPKAPQSPH